MLKNLLSKRFLENYIVSANGGTPAVDVSGCQTLAIELSNTVEVDKTFNSPELAALTFQSVTLTAQEAGVAGNDISITLLNTGEPSEPLAVVVADLAIEVTLETDAGVAASLVVQDLTYTADAVGEDGNDITIAYIADGTAGAETVNVTGTDIVVHMDDTPVTGSTATQIRTAVLASVPAAALVNVVVSGTGSNVQAAASETPLASGADPAIVTDADALVIAINADMDANALVEATGSGSSALTAMAEDFLEDGDDGEVDLETSTVSIPSHGFETGVLTRLTSTGTLPAPLATGTDFWIIKVSDDLIQLAESEEDAEAGTFIELEDAGSDGAVNTIDVAALTGASVKLQKSVTGDNWFDEGNATNITTSSTILFSKVDPECRFYRLLFAISTGQIIADAWVLGKGLDG